MVEVEAENGSNRKWDLWQKLEPNFNLSSLNDLDADGVKVQCVNSSEFVVGRQTNFNGPVTIINCENAVSGDLTLGNCCEGKNEKIVIRDKILSESATSIMREMAIKNAGKEDPEKSSAAGDEKKGLRRILAFPVGIWILFFAFLIGAAIISAMVFIKPDEEDREIVRCSTSTSKKSDEICIYGDYEWGGRKNVPNVAISLPVPYVVVSLTDSNFCFDFKMCLNEVENFQSRNLSDEKSVMCNFFVGGDGNIYEDRGWNLTNSLTGAAAGKTIDVCLIGNFVDYPTYPQVEATKNLIKLGVRNNLIAKNYVLTSSNATSSSRNVSSHVYNIIKKWPKFRENPFANEDDDEFEDEDHIIYQKKDWGGLPARSSIKMKLPVPYVVISHSVTPLCYEFKSCSAQLRQMQAYHFLRDFADIAYNFLVDSSGNVYEGRGWSKRNTAVSFVNGRNVNINFIGDFSETIKPTPKQIRGVKWLIQYGLENGKISNNYSLIAANSTYATLSPGKNVYEVIKRWPHFDPEPQLHIKDYDVV